MTSYVGMDNNQDIKSSIYANRCEHTQDDISGRTVRCFRQHYEETGEVPKVIKYNGDTLFFNQKAVFNLPPGSRDVTAQILEKVNQQELEMRLKREERLVLNKPSVVAECEGKTLNLLGDGSCSRVPRQDDLTNKNFDSSFENMLNYFVDQARNEVRGVSKKQPVVPKKAASKTSGLEFRMNLQVLKKVTTVVSIVTNLFKLKAPLQTFREEIIFPFLEKQEKAVSVPGKPKEPVNASRLVSKGLTILKATTIRGAGISVSIVSKVGKMIAPHLETVVVVGSICGAGAYVVKMIDNDKK